MGRDNQSLFWEGLFYPESCKIDPWEYLANLKTKVVCSPLHDKDTKKDGTLKKPHYHLLFAFDKMKGANQVRKICKDLGYDGAIEKPLFPSIAFQYLTHENKTAREEGKYLYDKNDLKYFNCYAEDFYGKDETCDAETNMQIWIEEYIDGNALTEYCDVSKILRRDCELRAEYKYFTKHTQHFREYIKSRRNQKYLFNSDSSAKAEHQKKGGE